MDNRSFEKLVEANSVLSNWKSESIQLPLQPLTNEYKQFRSEGNDKVDICHFIGPNTKRRPLPPARLPINRLCLPTPLAPPPARPPPPPPVVVVVVGLVVEVGSAAAVLRRFSVSSSSFGTMSCWVGKIGNRCNG